MILHKEYNYKHIETFADKHGYMLHESGIGETLGKSVIILDHYDKDSNLVFIMSSANGAGTPFYTLGYTDY